MGVMPNKTSGQMTIEFVVAFPAMIAVAFVAINAVLFFPIALLSTVYLEMRCAPMLLLLPMNREQMRAAD